MNTNERAFLAMLRYAEGTALAADPYRVLYGGGTWHGEMSSHPGEQGWAGVRLSDEQCRGAGYGPGCVAKAAGAYQATLGTWREALQKITLRDFSPAEQDRFALDFCIHRRGAKDAVRDGRFDEAVKLCRKEWASLPGANYAGQKMRSLEQLREVYADAGGTIYTEGNETMATNVTVLRDEPSAIPSRKVVASSGVAGIAAVVAYAAKHIAGIDIPAEHALTVVAMLVSVVGYFTRNAVKVPAARASLVEPAPASEQVTLDHLRVLLREVQQGRERT